MKKQRKELAEFKRIQSYLSQMKFQVKEAKSASLWSFESGIRKKLRKLAELESEGIPQFKTVQEDGLLLLNEVSKKLLLIYNKRNGTSYSFEEIVKNKQNEYQHSGIISVLVTSHIPALVAKDFEIHFPANPKDEYPEARTTHRKIFLHLGDTNTGKTYQALERLKTAEYGIYLAPLRMLALENYERLNSEGVPCHLITGEEELLTEGAKHISATVEKLDVNAEYGIAVVDEIQMIANSQRGGAWTRALLGLRCEELHLCGALHAKELLLKILEDCGDRAEVIEYTRPVPLEVIEKSFEFKNAAPGDALVVFSKRKVLELSKLFSDRGKKVSVIYGDLPPEVRKLQYNAFRSGENGILVTTDAIGMGVNLPIRRIIFMNLQKFDGEEVRYLNSQEIKQIGGRAGRKGIYETGYVGTYNGDIRYIRECLEAPDRPAEKAVIAPSEAILKIGGLPLREKVALWSTREETLEYYRKMDVRDYLLVLDMIKRYRFPEESEYKLMNLPFDVNSSVMQECFLLDVEEYLKSGGRSISKPKLPEATLSGYEAYYQMVGLYYSFSKNFHLSFEEEWVYHERARVSGKINDLLLSM